MKTLEERMEHEIELVENDDNFTEKEKKNNMKKKICQIIAEHYPHSKNDVLAVFDIIKTYDGTIEIMNFASQFAKNPVILAEEVMELGYINKNGNNKHNIKR